MRLFSSIAAKWKQWSGQTAKPAASPQSHEDRIRQQQRQLTKGADEWKKRHVQTPPPPD